MVNKKIYIETQNIVPIWLIIFIGLTVLIVSGCVTFSEQGFQWLKEGVVPLVIAIAVIALLSIPIKTQIDEDGVTLGYKPFFWDKKYHWDEIADMRIRRISIFDFGGLGFRIGRGGIGLIGHSRTAFQILLNNGKRISVTTKNPEEVVKILRDVGFEKKHDE